MTIIREDATFCGDCTHLYRAYIRGKRAWWRQEFYIVHGRDPTPSEEFRCGPSGPVMGPNGYPDCEKCKGTGVYIVEADGSITPGGLLSATVGGGYLASESAIEPCPVCGEDVPGALRKYHARLKHDAPGGALADLADVGEEVRELRERLSALHRRRNLLILAASDEGKTRNQVAQRAGITRGRVQQIIDESKTWA